MLQDALPQGPPQRPEAVRSMCFGEDALEQAQAETDLFIMLLKMAPTEVLQGLAVLHGLRVLQQAGQEEVDEGTTVSELYR